MQQNPGADIIGIKYEFLSRCKKQWLSENCKKILLTVKYFYIAQYSLNVFTNGKILENRIILNKKTDIFFLLSKLTFLHYTEAF